jgi:hypothetical protein
VAIILVAIGGYFISDYWWLLMVVLLMNINGYFRNGSWWLL